MDCIFCKIIRKEMKADIVYEDGGVVAFNDIHPKAPVHVLVVTKVHISSVNELRAKDSETVSAVLFAAPVVAKKMGVGDGYKLAFNVGKKGGQVIDHLHMHLLGWPDNHPQAGEQKEVFAV